MKRQNQHEVPRFYLEAFCDPTERNHVWVFTRTAPYAKSRRRGKGNPFLSGIDLTTASVNRYAGQTGDGALHVERWEQQLQRRENAADGALRRVRAKAPLMESDKEVLTDYLLTMWLRVRKRWVDSEKRVDAHVAKSDFDGIARELAFRGLLSTARQIYDAKRFLTSPAGKKNLLLESMVHEMTTCRAALLQMTWNFVCPPAGTFFFTNDAPFMFDERLGLRASHVLFPVSPEVMLIAGHDDPAGTPYATVSTETALKLNSFAWTAAHREVYASSPARWIYDMGRYGVTFDASGAHINKSEE